MLNRKFRMNSFIAEFPNCDFYENLIQCHEDLEIKTNMELEGLMIPIMFVDTKMDLKIKYTTKLMKI